MMLHFAKATRVFIQTLPFVLLRMGIGVLLGVVAILYFGFVVFLVTTLTGSLSGGIAILALLAATLIFYVAWRFFSRYVLYLVKVAHIAVIAHIIDTGEVPSNQIQYGKAQVSEKFVEASALFAVDQVIKAVIKQFNRAVVRVARFASVVPALKNVVQVLGRAIGLAASYIDEAIIAHMFISGEENRWRAARDGVVLYGKNWKPVLGSTLLIVLAMYAVSFVFFLLLAPVASLLGGLSPLLEVVSWVLVAGIVLTVYTGFLKPWVKTVVITTFLIESADTSPDSETMNRIAERSSRFSELLEKAETDGEESKTPLAH